MRRSRGASTHFFKSQLCFRLVPLLGDSASSRRIHPPPFGLPPSPRGARGNRFLAKANIPTMSIIPSMQPLREGARQRRRMNAAQPRNLNSLLQISVLLSSDSSAGRFRLSEADPSPALWAAPFSKGARDDRFLTKANIPTMSIIPSMQPLREGARQRRRMDCREAASPLKNQSPLPFSPFPPQ
ncbi:MAG: hypothetical protein ACFWUL_11655 [Dialister sp.]|jgi:hypothetical protein